MGKARKGVKAECTFKGGKTSRERRILKGNQKARLEGN